MCNLFMKKWIYFVLKELYKLFLFIIIFNVDFLFWLEFDVCI